MLRDPEPVSGWNDWPEPIWPESPESETEPLPETPETELPEQFPGSVPSEQVQPALPSAWLQWFAWMNLWLRELVPPELWEGEFLPPGSRS